jgi:hypothetical protein
VSRPIASHRLPKSCQNQNQQEEKMGKIADNERIKLKATFFNNIAVGCAVAGFIVPYLALIQKYNEIQTVLKAYTSGTAGLDNGDVKNLLLLLSTFFVSIAIARWFRHRANREIEQLQD